MTIRISGEKKRKVRLGDLVQIKASLVGTFGLEFCYASMLLNNSGVLHGLDERSQGYSWIARIKECAEQREPSKKKKLRISRKLEAHASPMQDFKMKTLWEHFPDNQPLTAAC